MADDANGAPAPASDSSQDPTTYANNPADSTTWSPGFAAQMEAAVASRQASDRAAANASALAVLEPCAFLVSPALAVQIAALKALAKQIDTGDEDPGDLNFIAVLRNAANSLAQASQQFAPRYAAVGGVAPTS